MLAFPAPCVPSPMLAFQRSSGQRLLSADRRDQASRDRLLRRVRQEFREMPCLRLTDTQSARLFGLSAPVCGRVLKSLVGEGTLWTGVDGRYGLRER